MASGRNRRSGDPHPHPHPGGWAGDLRQTAWGQGGGWALDLGWMALVRAGKQPRRPFWRPVVKKEYFCTYGWMSADTHQESGTAAVQEIWFTATISQWVPAAQNHQTTAAYHYWISLLLDCNSHQPWININKLRLSWPLSKHCALLLGTVQIKKWNERQDITKHPITTAAAL